MNVTVYCASTFGVDPRIKESAEKLGTWLAEHGHTLVYGGSSVGIMGVVSSAALAAGGKVEGVEPQFFIDAGVAQHDLTHLHVVETMNERKAKMIELGDVFVALPGGVGTLEEISEIMSRERLRMKPPQCFLLNIDGFWDPMKDQLRNMVAQKFLHQDDCDSYHFPATVDELIEQLDTAAHMNGGHVPDTPPQPPEIIG